MEPWRSESNPRKQTALAIGCAIMGLLIVIALRHSSSGGVNAAAGFWLGVGLLLLGVGGALVAGKQTIVVDPRTRRITIEDSNRLGSKTRGIPFDSILSVSVGFLGKESNRVTWYYLLLKLPDGEEYPLFAPGRCYEGASDRSTVEIWRRRLEGYVGAPA